MSQETKQSDAKLATELAEIFTAWAEDPMWPSGYYVTVLMRERLLEAAALLSRAHALKETVDAK